MDYFALKFLHFCKQKFFYVRFVNKEVNFVIINVF